MRNVYKRMGVMGLIAILALTGCTKEDDADAVKASESQDISKQEIKVSDIPEEIRFLGDEVKIKQVINGDTVVVTGKNGDETVRLSLIDAPESANPNEPEQIFGRDAGEFAKSYLTPGMTVILERGAIDKDKNERTLGYIWDGRTNFNQMMVDEGYARLDMMNAEYEPYLEEFQMAEERAKASQKNIWSIDGYVTDDGFDMGAVMY